MVTIILRSLCATGQQYSGCDDLRETASEAVSLSCFTVTNDEILKFGSWKVIIIPYVIVAPIQQKLLSVTQATLSEPTHCDFIQMAWLFFRCQFCLKNFQHRVNMIINF